MSGQEPAARARPSEALVGPARPPRAPRPALDPAASSGELVPSSVLELPPWSRPSLTAGFALGWALTLAGLGTITAVWLVGMIATTLFWVLGQGKLGSVIVLGITGVLLGRGWVGMAQTLHGRLRKRDLAEPAALPDAFWALSPPLQRVVRHARSLQLVLRDPDLRPTDLDREVFEWIAAVARLPEPDQARLTERGLTADVLREQLVESRWSTDRAGRAGPRRSTHGRSDHRAHARELLERFEAQVLQAGRDPFRGGLSPEPSASATR